MSTPAAGRLQDRLGRFGARLSGSTLRTGTGGFLSWWGSALASWLPPRVRQLLGMDRGRLLLLVEGDVLHLRLQRGDEVHPKKTAVRTRVVMEDEAIAAG